MSEQDLVAQGKPSPPLPLRKKQNVASPPDLKFFRQGVPPLAGVYEEASE